MVKKFRNDRHEELYKKFLNKRNDYFINLAKSKFNDTYRGQAFYFSEGIKIHESMNEELHPKYTKVLRNIKVIDDLNHIDRYYAALNPESDNPTYKSILKLKENIYYVSKSNNIDSYLKKRNIEGIISSFISEGSYENKKIGSKKLELL